MNKEEWIFELKQKEELQSYINKVQQTDIAILLEIIENEKTAVKYLAEKIVRQISEKNPILLYPYFDRIVKLLNSDNNFIVLGTLLTIPNLLLVDKEEKWKSVKEKYFSFLETESIAVFGNVVRGLSKIIDKYPEEEKNIVPQLLKIEEHIFLHKGQPSKECNNVAKGHILDFFLEKAAQSVYQKEMLNFAKENLNNPRNQVKVKAKKVIKVFEK